MAEKDSKKSTGRVVKSRSAKNPPNSKNKRRTNIDPETESIEPVTDVIAIPAALIEIRESLNEMYLIDDETFKDPHSIFKFRNCLNSVLETVQSCISAIKAEGLKEMGFDVADGKILLEAVRLFARSTDQTDSQLWRIKNLVQGLVIFTESDPEVIAAPSPLPTKSIIDQNMENAAKMNIDSSVWVGDLGVFSDGKLTGPGVVIKHPGEEGKIYGLVIGEDGEPELTEPQINQSSGVEADG